MQSDQGLGIISPLAEPSFVRAYDVSLDSTWRVLPQHRRHTLNTAATWIMQTYYASTMA